MRPIDRRPMAVRWASHNTRGRPGPDGLGTMGTEHWRAYVKGLREARKAAETGEGAATAASGPEAEAA